MMVGGATAWPWLTAPGPTALVAAAVVGWVAAAAAVVVVGWGGATLVAPRPAPQVAGVSTGLHRTFQRPRY